MTPPLSQRWTTHSEYIDLLNYILERAENVESPMNIKQLAREFKVKSEKSRTLACLKSRIDGLRSNIHNLKQVDTNTKVKLMFALSASVDADFLEELKKNALVEVDEKQRIAHYIANDGSFELRGDHSLSAKSRTSQFESKRTLRSWIIDYFENKTNANAVPKNEEMRETGKLIEFITEKCENVDYPLSIYGLAKDFTQHFGISVPLMTICNRVKVYCRVIQTLEFLDTPSKVKQLFGLSATLDSKFLEELRKNASVEVDLENRIIMYMANDNSLTLRGRHWESRRKNKVKGVLKMSGYGGLDDGSDEYSSEELDNEFYSDDEAGMIEMSIEDDFVFDPKPPTAPKSSKRKTDTAGFSSSKRTRPSPNDSMRPNELDDYDMNYSIEDQVKLEPFRGSIQEDFKEKEDQDIQQIPKTLHVLDERNQIEEVPIKVEPEELKIVENPTEDVKPEIAQAHDEHKELIEVPIKVEYEESVKVKPETSHNPKIRFFEAMQSLIICLDTPSLSWIQSKTHQKIQKLGLSNEVILNSEISLTIELLIARMANHSVVNISKNVESVNFSNFLCYLKASILNSEMSGVEDLVKNISELIEESQIKRIFIEEVANALRATLAIDGF